MNSVGRNLLSALLVVLVCAEVFEVLHPEPQSLPIFRVVLALDGVAKDLKLVFVVFEQRALNQVRSGVIDKV